MIRTHFTPSLTVPILIAKRDGDTAILLNPKLYARIPAGLRDALWNRAFADCEALMLGGARDDLAVKRQARATVEARLAERAAVPQERRSVPRLSIASASNVIPSV